VAATLLVATGGYLVMPPQLLASARVLMSRRPAVLHVNRVIVYPFDNKTGDPKLASVGAMVADWVGEGLSRLPNLQVVDAQSTMISGQVVSRIPRFLRIDDDARAVAQETGAKVLVTGTVYGSGDSLTLRARVIDAATGALMQMLPEVRASAATPGPGIEALRRRVVATLRGASDTSMSYMPGVLDAPPTIEAYDEIRKGVELYFRSDPRSFDHIHAAMRLDSTYAAPFVFNAFASSVRLGLPQADTAARLADRLRERMTPAEQAMVDYVHAIVDGDPDASTAAAQRFMTSQPGSMEAPLLAASNAVATYHPRLALEALARSDPDRGMNLAGPFYWMYRAEAARQLGDHSAFLAAAREGRKRFPQNGNAYAWYTIAMVDANRLDELDEALGELRAPGMGPGFATVAVAALQHAGRDADAKRFLDEWMPRVPTDTAGGGSIARSTLRAVFLLESQRWPELETLARPRVDTTYADPRRLPFSAMLGAALAHQHRTAEAESIANAIASQHPHYSRGEYLYARAIIATHLGDKAQAVSLLNGAVQNGYKLQFAGTLFGFDPSLVPLRGYPPFDALLKRGL
jgi:TolB-like protein/tetratricopeptide (TPR) repeat protein